VIEEKRVVEKILRSIPSHLWQVAIVITTLLDVQILSVPNGRAPEDGEGGVRGTTFVIAARRKTLPH
jgi:hypothetical protein